jgi:DNA-binding NarL/FixJ family response regulator
MPIKVLIADDSRIILPAIRRELSAEPLIEVVAEASTFAETMQMINDFKPDVLLLDLYMPERRDFTPDFVKSQLVSVNCVLAMSFSNDSEAKALAERYGAVSLLDKMNLVAELVPAILGCPRAIPQDDMPDRIRSRKTPSITPINITKHAIRRHAS